VSAFDRAHLGSTRVGPIADPPSGRVVHVPSPEEVTRTQIRCPEPGCNRRFTKLDRYKLHWLVVHEPEKRSAK
jgi:hypothetical protein